ncbi:unnamed protein product [Vitrella brassicaformis CCMP3155]|uniref:Uncharacterized protein n=3 Tax=Vitrella brassicaformis TaxID=1169539 RepID=A0A0G4F4N2_VITBC|nr:unnamed protein product [Vitrella brassicaformis CCMP3155]|eukprot:CEM07034.1 unnamed protein product [Vitrella brassicaformis CCMP3155]
MGSQRKQLVLKLHLLQHRPPPSDQSKREVHRLALQLVDFRLMNLTELLFYCREGSERKLLHRPFWSSAFGRARQLLPLMGAPHLAFLSRCMIRIGCYDTQLLDHYTHILLEKAIDLRGNSLCESMAALRRCERALAATESEGVEVPEWRDAFLTMCRHLANKTSVLGPAYVAMAIECIADFRRAHGWDPSMGDAVRALLHHSSGILHGFKPEALRCIVDSLPIILSTDASPTEDDSDLSARIGRLVAACPRDRRYSELWAFANKAKAYVDRPESAKRQGARMHAREGWEGGGRAVCER